MDEKIKAVVVDDEPDVCLLIKSILEDSTHFVVTATNKPKEAVALIRQVKPQIILLDIVMADYSGPEIIAELDGSKELRRIPIIVVSGKGEFIYDKRKRSFQWQPNTPLANKYRSLIPGGRSAETMAEAYGVADYISKPFNGELLVQIVLDVLARFKPPDEGADSFSDL